MNLVALFLTLAPQVGWPQGELPMFQSKVPQAQSRQEFDEFLDLAQLSDQNLILNRIQQFREHFPGSAFAPQTFRMEMKVYQARQDYKKALAAGEQALKRNPEDIDTLLTLASMLSQTSTQAEKEVKTLVIAEGYARQALNDISSLKADRSMRLEDWRSFKGRLEASARSSLGLIALNRGSYADAIQELELCTRLNTIGAADQYYLLGRAYRLYGDPILARTALLRSAAIGSRALKQRVDVELSLLEKSR